MPTLDYIRILGIAGISASDTDKLDVTFEIEHSDDDEFSSTHTGVITLRLSEFIDTLGFSNQDIEIIATKLIQQVLKREKDDEGTIEFYHIIGQPLGEWITEHTPFLNQ